MKNKKDIDYSLYLVTDRKVLGKRDLLTSIEDAIKGGVSIVQLREKNIKTLEFYEIAYEVRKLTHKYDIPFIINDRLDIALAVNADGIHIGPEDIPLNIARSILGPDKIIGYSASNIDEAIIAQKLMADYLGVGAMYPTNTKDNTESVTIDDLANIKSKVNIPVVAIGGINENNIKEVLETNIDGVAVVSAILGKNDICNGATALHNIFQNKYSKI